MRDAMRTRCSAIVSTAVVVIVSAYQPAARAGDDGLGFEEHEQAERAIRRLRRQGVAAAPNVVRALRSDEGLLAQVAEDELVRWGAPAAPALLDALAKHRPPPGKYSDGYETEERTLSKVLCHAGRPALVIYD